MSLSHCPVPTHKITKSFVWVLSEVCYSDKQIQKYCWMFYNKLEQGHEFKGQQKKAFLKVVE